MSIPSGNLADFIHNIAALLTKSASLRLHVGLFPIPLTSGPALFDISTTYISFHTGLLFVVAEAVGASFDFKAEQFYIDCAKVPSMSDLIFTLQQDPSTGATFDLRPVPRKDGKCTVLFRPISELLAPSYNARYIFGSSAAISHCWAYDFEKDSIAFSQALNA
ncbi:hypothetical protein AAVH_39699 [Aphelenchoides avenae]|nr:hypothetical protein AAVH_39699 [Aphelenchus avenae]